MYKRYSRLPASIDNLVAIVRKAELHPQVSGWSPGRLANTLIRRFRIDGITYDGCVDTSTGALPYVIDMQDEYAKMALVLELLSGVGTEDDFPEDALSAEEGCSLHWMLSYVVNATFREDEFFWTTDFEANYEHGTNEEYNYGKWHYTDERPPLGSPGQWVAQSHRVHKGEMGHFVTTPAYRRDLMPRPCEDYKPVSQAPWEVGAVWHPAGPLAVAPMMAGLAAGLEPQTLNWAEGQMTNFYGTSLSGDLGQTALLKQRDEPYVGPDGYFNSTTCPAEFYLRNMFGDSAVFSHLTVSEINGGIDGLVMARFANEWERKSELTLSQILNMYYSVYGIRDHGEKLSACERYRNYYELIDAAKLTQEAFVFGAELRNTLVVPIDENSLKVSIDRAKEKLDNAVAILDQSLNAFGPCKDQRERDGYESVDKMTGYSPSPIDAEAPSVGIADVAIVLDTSLYLFEDQVYLKQLAAGIISGLDVWTTKSEDRYDVDRFIAGGSVVEVVDGRFGQVIVSSETGDFTNKAHMACQLVRSDVPQTGDLDPPLVLETVASRIHTRQVERELKGYGDGRAQVVVLILFGQIATGDIAEFNDAVYRVRRYYPSVRLLIATRWASPQEFYEYVLYPDFDVFALSVHNEELRAENDARRIGRRIAQIPGSIMYTDCEDPDEPEQGENKREEFVYAIPDTQRFLMVQPHYFAESDEFTMEFDVDYNGVEICWSRASPEEQALGESREQAYTVFEDGHWHRYDQVGNDEDQKALEKELKRRRKDDEELDLGMDCQRSSGKSDSVDFTFEDPCDGESYTRCRAIYFRLTGIDNGGTNCLTEDRNPCRTATSALITVTHEGMMCGANVVLPTLVSLIALVIINLILK